MAIAGDLRQAFLQMRVRKADRHALRFHLLKDLKTKQVEVLCFIRVLFGLASSLHSFLAAVIKEHLQNCKLLHEKIVDEINRSLYVDDQMSGGETIDAALQVKQSAPLLEDLKHKWLKWEGNLPKQTTVPRSLAAYQEKIIFIDLHGFGDASGTGVSATVYAVVE